MDAHELSDAELVARCRRGEEAAWHTLVERFSRYVYAIATRGFGLAEHDAEDVFQEVFARVYERLDSLHEAAALRPWIAQVTRRLCLDQHRAAGREQPTDVVEPEGVDERISELDEALAVHEALGSLPEHCREILDRFFAQDESYRTIGEALGLPAGTIASRISRCLTKLKTELAGRTRPSSASEKTVVR